MAKSEHPTPETTTPLCEQRIISAEEENELYHQIAQDMIEGRNSENFESRFHNIGIDEGSVLAHYSPFHISHIENPQLVETRIPGVSSRVGNFVDNGRLRATVEEAKASSTGHFGDHRGSLTLLKQGKIDRLAEVVPNGEIPDTLADTFDKANSPVTSVYTSDTNTGEARDSYYEPGKTGMHIHFGQTDRFVFTEGKWEIVLLDLRPEAGANNLVCLSFDASQDNQLALTIPPGVGHTIANVRGNCEAATLVNFPTQGYAVVPEHSKEVVAAEAQRVADAASEKGQQLTPEQAANKMSVRATESRLDFARVGTAAQEKFSWQLYTRWLLTAEMDRLGADDRKVIFPGGVLGFLGSELRARFLAGDEVKAIESAGLAQIPHTSEGREMHFGWNLTKASEQELKAWIEASEAKSVVVTGAWTDVGPCVPLANFINANREALDSIGLLGKDPVSQININFIERLAHAIASIPEEERPNLVLPDTTFSTFPNLSGIGQYPFTNYYAASKFQGIARARSILGEGNVRVVRLGYPYLTREATSFSAKSMTVHKWVDRILDRLPPSALTKLSPFHDDAIDPTNMDRVVETIETILAGEQPQPYPTGWLTSAELCRMIIEEIAEQTSGDATDLEEAIMTPVPGSSYNPTNAQMFGKTPEDHPLYKWITEAVKKMAAAGIDFDLETFMEQPAGYADAYPKSKLVTISGRDDPYIHALRQDVADIVRFKLAQRQQVA